MATNIYNKQSTFNIDSLSVLDFIVKYNTVNYVEVEIIFNCDIEQIINKYAVNFSLVNPSDTSVVFASFTPSGSNFGIIKNTIPVNGGVSAYTQSLSYFTFRYTDNNHFKNGNGSVIVNTPAEGAQFQLQVTINGVSRLFNTKRFNTYRNATMPLQPTTFNYLQTYNLAVGNYYFQNTDTVKVKINNQNSVNMTVNAINNYATSVDTPIRLNTVSDFIHTPTAKCSFAGTNSYALVKNYNILSALTQSTMWINKSGFDKNINPTLQPNSIFTALQVGCNKLFNTTLKKCKWSLRYSIFRIPFIYGIIFKWVGDFEYFNNIYSNKS